MATGKASDFKIYNEQFFGGFVETLQQNTDAFNAASKNAIRLTTAAKKGDYEYESFIQHISGLVSRRDATSVAGVTGTGMTQSEIVAVKLNRKIGPIEQTVDALRKIGASQQELSIMLGQQTAAEVMGDYLNSAIIGTAAALSFSGWEVDKSGGSPTTLTHGYLAAALAKMGDAAQKITCWVMHSKPYYDLIGQSITDKVTNVADVTIVDGSVPALGRPVIVTDSTALVSSSDYITLGLVVGGVEVIESEQRDLVTQVVTGLENLVVRIQGEYAFNLKIKGFQWDVGDGGANPDDSALGTLAHWDKVAFDNRLIAGVRLKTK